MHSSNPIYATITIRRRIVELLHRIFHGLPFLPGHLLWKYEWDKILSNCSDVRLCQNKQNYESHCWAGSEISDSACSLANIFIVSTFRPFLRFVRATISIVALVHSSLLRLEINEIGEISRIDANIKILSWHAIQNDRHRCTSICSSVGHGNQIFDLNVYDRTEMLTII